MTNSFLTLAGNLLYFVSSAVLLLPLTARVYGASVREQELNEGMTVDAMKTSQSEQKCMIHMRCEFEIWFAVANRYS